VLSPELETVDRPGDSVRTSAMVFDWKSFCRHAPNILADAERLLEPHPIAHDVPAAQRLQIVRPTIELRTRRPRSIRDLSSAALSILAGIVDGDLVRLGSEDCRDEPAFLSALADVFEIMPEPFRGNIAVAAGLTLPDQAIQIAWARGLASTARHNVSIDGLLGSADPEMPLSEAGLRLFANQHPATLRATEVSSAARYAGELISTRSDAGVMPQVRCFLSRLATPAGSSVKGRADQPLDCAGAAQIIADLIASKAVLKQRRALIRFAADAQPEVIESLMRECGRYEQPAISTVAQVLCRETRNPIDLHGLAAALVVARDAAADPDTKRFGASLALRTRAELAAFLRSKLLLTEPMLRAIVASDDLSAMAADVLAEEDRSVSVRLLDSTSVIELLSPEGQALASTVRQRLMPRGGKANGAWRSGVSDVANQARALAALISAEPLEPRDLSQHASALASRLIEDRRRDLVVDAVRSISTRLSLCDAPNAAADIAVESRRLEVLVSLAKVLQGPAAAAHGTYAPQTRTFRWSS
jgi:hypothetical protein